MPYPVALRVIISDMAICRPSPPPSDGLEHVVLARLTDDLRPFWFVVGTVEGTVGDEVLVRFGEIVVQAPPEMVKPVNDKQKDQV